MQPKRPNPPRGEDSDQEQKGRFGARQRSTLWILLAAIFVFFLVQHLFSLAGSTEIPYSQFKENVRNGRYEEVAISDQYIVGTLGDDLDAQDDGRKPPLGGKARAEERAIRVEDEELVKLLEEKGIAFKGKIQSTWLRDTLFLWLLPIGVIVLLWVFVFRRMGPGSQVMSFGRSKARLWSQDEVNVTFQDVAGVDEAVEELREVVDFLQNPAKYQRLGGTLPKGILLVGPPGTGKTLLGRAVAGEAEVSFFSMNGSDFVEMFVGVGAARIRDLFAQAIEKAPCILFIDELDALGKVRVASPIAGHDEREQTLNQLLAEMDGFETKKGVIILAATNRPEILDSALLRPGRFDRQVLVDRPDIRGREAIFKVHTREVKIAPDLDLKTLAARTPGFVGADIRNAVNEAALLAARKGKDSVGLEDLEEAIERTVAGLEKKKRVISDRERSILAYHESGHAIVGETLEGSDPVHKISIVQRGIAALGYTMQLPTEDRYILTRSELLDRLTSMLGGRAAEEVALGISSTGAHNDLQRVTEMARSMVTELGMSTLGPVAYGRERKPLYLEAPGLSTKEYSEQTAREIDQEVRRLVEEGYERAKEILQGYREALDRLAELLLEREVLRREEFLEVLDASGTEEETPAVATRVSMAGWLLAPALVALVVLALGLLLVRRTTRPPRYPWKRPPSDFGVRFEEVRVPARDGTPLAAWFLPAGGPSPPGPGPAVLVLHGLGAARHDLSDVGAALARAGLAVLLPDLRGHGDTPGRSSLGPREAEDVRELVAWLAARTEVDPARIGGFGFSMGGAALLLAAAAGAPLRAVAADSSYVSLRRAVELGVSRLYRLPAVPFAWVARLGYRVLLGHGMGDADVRAAVRRLPALPLLLVAGSHDLLGAAESARAIEEAHAGPHEVWIVEGSRHGATFSAPGYVERVASFLRRNL